MVEKPFFNNDEKEKLTKVHGILDDWVMGRGCCGDVETCENVNDNLKELGVTITMRFGRKQRKIGK